MGIKAERAKRRRRRRNLFIHGMILLWIVALLLTDNATTPADYGFLCLSVVCEIT